MVDEVYVNPLLRVPLWLSVLVTTTFTAPAAWAAVVAVIEVLLTTVTVLAAVPPTVTVAPERKPVPLMVTAVPPLTDPAPGEIAVTVGAGKLPLTDTVNVGLTGSVVLMFNKAARAPAADGLNVTWMGQLPPAATPVPPVAQLPFAIAKSPWLAPLKVMLLTIRFCPASVVMLDSVTVFAGSVVPSGTAGGEKDSDAGVRLATGATPLPLNEITRLGLLNALLVMVRVWFCAPLAGGVKVTLTVQVALGASVPPQLPAGVVAKAKLPVITMLLMVSGPVPELLTVNV